MKSLISLIIFSLKENLRTKLYVVLLIFTIILIFIGLLLTGLSGFEQPQRVLVNTGIAMMELFCLFLILLNSVNLFLQDIESKSVYLTLSKSISRSKYLVGKYFGSLLLILINILIMSIIHILLIKLSRWKIPENYYFTLFTIFLKTGVVASISLLAVTTMTSQATAVITSLLIWIAGHFISEILFLAGRIKIMFLQFFLRICCYIIPNFQYFNVKDYFDTHYFVAKFGIVLAIIYWIVYNSLVLILSCVVFNKKDL
ncbi:MAG: ABC transporter permease subunit [Endomicrobia bacterium]|nr:ABC transporter permease subunit [Endomicrobiia bacterium]